LGPTACAEAGPARTLVLGLGNLLLGDEGAGVHVAQRLGELALPDHVQVMDAGTAPAPALAAADRFDRLIIVDALDVQAGAGEVYRLTVDQVVQSSRNVSLHELDLGRLLQTLEEWGRLPEEIVILGVTPGQIRWGTELSPELRAKLPQIVQAVATEACKPCEEGAKRDDS